MSLRAILFFIVGKGRIFIYEKLNSPLGGFKNLKLKFDFFLIHASYKGMHTL